MHSTNTGQAGMMGADNGMQALVELERRISAALTRISDGLAALPLAADRGADPSADHSAELDALRAELAAERAARAEVQANLDAALAAPAAGKDLGSDAGSSSGRVAELQEQVDRLTKLLDVQGLDLVRLRKTVGTLRESLQTLRTAQVATLPDTAAINRALLAEVDAMRAERQSEMAELDEIIAELDPLLQPVTTEEGRDNG
jgi:hypothetical protein